MLQNLPPEVIIHIFAEISIADRLEISLCSKYYNQLLHDDFGWRLAFLKRFKSLPLVGLKENFKAEYLHRLDLITWGKQSLNQVTIPTPATDPSAIYLYSKQTLLLGSVNDGFITQLDPLTGKRGREDLWISDGQRERISCLLIDGARAWAGLLDGSVLGSFYSKAKWHDWTLLRSSNNGIVSKIKRVKDCNLLFLGISNGSVELIDWAKEEMVLVFHSEFNGKVDFIEYSKKLVLFGGSINIMIFSYDVYNKHEVNRTSKKIECDSSLQDFWIDDTHSIIICWTVNSLSRLCYDQDQNQYVTEPISAMNFSAVAYYESKKSILCAGDNHGLINIWKITTSGHELLKTLNTHKSPISCLSFTPEALLSASSDGEINMFDGINLSFVRSLNRKKRNPHPDMQRWRVDYLLFKSGMVIAGQRDSITSFVRRPPKLMVSHRKSKKVRVSFGRSSRQSSLREKEEVNYEVAEVLDALEIERSNRELALHRLEKSNGCMQNHGMSENELVEYVKVLSAGESRNNLSSPTLEEQENLNLALMLSLSLLEQQK